MQPHLLKKQMEDAMLLAREYVAIQRELCAERRTASPNRKADIVEEMRAAQAYWHMHITQYKALGETYLSTFHSSSAN